MNNHFSISSIETAKMNLNYPLYFDYFDEFVLTDCMSKQAPHAQGNTLSKLLWSLDNPLETTSISQLNKIRNSNMLKPNISALQSSILGQMVVILQILTFFNEILT